MPHVFFRATVDALDNITSIFDFVHPLNVSLRFTRSKVQEEYNYNPSYTDSDFQALFDPDQNVHGANYKRAFITTNWEEQEERLAWILLNNLFAIHEGWAQRLHTEIFNGYGYDDKVFTKNLEFPGLSSKFSSYFAPRKKTSSILSTSFYIPYKSACNLDFSKLENYMLCYRYFKEARNCFMHRNFVASQAIIDAYCNLLSIYTTANFDVSEVPKIIPPVLNKPVRLSLRGVIGFSQIVQRIMIISDINLIKCKAAEKEFLARIPSNWNSRTLSSDQSTAHDQISIFSRKLGLLKATWSIDYQNFLINNHLFNI